MLLVVWLSVLGTQFPGKSSAYFGLTSWLTGGVRPGGILAPRRAALTAAMTPGSERTRVAFTTVGRITAARASAPVAFSWRRIFAPIEPSVRIATTATAAAETGTRIALADVRQRARRIGFSISAYE